MADNPFEIPQQIRDLAEQNIKQAHAAYEQLTDFVTKAIDAWMGAMPTSPMATGFKDFQDRAAEIAKKNAEFGFRAGRKDRQSTKYPGASDTSDAVRSRADAGFRDANAGASRADRRSSAEAATQLILQQKPRPRERRGKVPCLIATMIETPAAKPKAKNNPQVPLHSRSPAASASRRF